MNHSQESKMNQGLSRRSFIRTGAATVAASTCLGGLPLLRSAHAAGGDTIKIALIGCGGRGTGAAVQALSTQGPVKLWAMADLFADKLESSLTSLTKGTKGRYDTQAHGGLTNQIDVPPERRFVGFDAYKKAIDSGVDMVILATTPHFRPMQFEYAAGQGKHVFMEKPVAIDAYGVRQVLAASAVAKQKNLKVGVGLQRHHDGRYIETVKRLRDGAIGPILAMRAYWNGTGYRTRDPRQPGMSEMLYQVKNPYHYTWLSGDHVVEQHVHNLDVCYWIKGALPVSAQGQGGRQVRIGPEFGDIYDHHFVEFTYADGSQVFSQCRHITGCWGSVAEFAAGPQGKADVGAGRIETASGLWRYQGPKSNPYQVEHDDLFDAIRNDKPMNEADFGAQSTMMGVLGRMATYSGQVVTWEAAIKSAIRLAPDRYDFDATPPVLPGKDGIYPAAVPGATKVL